MGSNNDVPVDDTINPTNLARIRSDTNYWIEPLGRRLQPIVKEPKHYDSIVTWFIWTP